MSKLLADNRYRSDVFIPFENYIPKNHYFDEVAKLLPKMWRLKQDYFWTYALAPQSKKLVQGWKVHVSATPDSALEILNIVVPILITNHVEFKFASDQKILRKLLGKTCPRQSSGKFLTIYPKSFDLFKSLLETLYLALGKIDGPYILSDRQYKDSNILFYRYGGFHSLTELSVDGTSKNCILNNHFEYIEDVRAPNFSIPEFVADALDDQSQVHSSKVAPQKTEILVEKPIFGDDYEISSVLQYSNTGGVYVAKNISTEELLVIKEARPFAGYDESGVDAIARLSKEFRILKKIEDLGIAPKPYKLFFEWKHSFLAQEKVEGQSLRQFITLRSPLIQAQATRDIMHQWVSTVLQISIQLFQKVIQLHRKGIVFGDISLNNIIINPENLEIKFIDFEGAVELGVDSPTNMFTPGFGKKTRLAKKTIDFCDDYYALGTVLLAFFAPNRQLLELKDDYHAIVLSELRNDVGLPEEIIRCIVDLHSENSISLQSHVEQLKLANLDSVRAYSITLQDPTGIRDYCKTTIDAIFSYNLEIMDLSARGRMFPIGERSDNPLALDTGLLGIAYSWKRIKGSLPIELNTWITSNAFRDLALPGLVNGMCGVSWVMSELGLEKQARSALKRASEHTLLFQKMNFAHGAAGYGMCNLRFWSLYEEESYLLEAIKIADIICDSSIEIHDGCVWGDLDQERGVDIGFLEGGSGIALFLMYAFCVTGNERYLRIGEQALTFEISNGIKAGDLLNFPRYSKNPHKVIYPYFGFGAAGIGSVALRYYAITKKKKYLNFLDEMKLGVSHKYAVSAGLFQGLAGLGNYLLDAYQILNDESYLHLAYRAAAGVRLFEIRRPSGSTFPALIDDYVNTDYSTGSAGIALFFHRLVNNSENFNFYIDELMIQFLKKGNVQLCA